jgi:hypothetical protein
VSLLPTSTSTSSWRWWILSTYTLNATMQTAVWALPGIIPSTLGKVYGIDDGTNHMLLNYGPITYLTFAVFFSWSIDKHGCRVATAISVFLVLASCLSRVFANDSSPLSLFLLHLSFILNGTAGPVAMALPSKLASEWFLPEERTTATAIATLGNQAGVVFLFIAVPFVCPDNAATLRDVAIKENFSLNVGLAALSVLNVIMFCVYFPARPPVPPSLSAGAAQSGESAISFRSLLADGYKLFQSVPYVVILLSYAFTSGFGNDAGSLLASNLGPLDGNDQSVSGWVGAIGNGGGMFVGLWLAYASDKFKAQQGLLKRILVGTLVVCGCAYLFFAMCLADVVPVSRWGTAGLNIAITGYVIATVLANAAVPLMFDIMAEQSFGIAPIGTSLMIMTYVSNLISLVGFVAPPQSLFSWLNWTVAGVVLFSAVAVQLLLPKTLPKFEFDAASDAHALGLPNVL